MVLEYSQKYANLKYKHFVQLMKQEAFWPEVNIGSQLLAQNVEQVHKEDKGIALTNVKVDIPQITAIMLHKQKPVYLLNLQLVSLVQDSMLRDSNMVLRVRKITLYNTAKIAADHKKIISTRSKEEYEFEQDHHYSNPDEDVLVLQIKNLSTYDSKVHNYSMWVGKQSRRGFDVYWMMLWGFTRVLDNSAQKLIHN